MSDKEDDQPIKVFLCKNCRMAPQKPSGSYCNACDAFLRRERFMLATLENNIRAARIARLNLPRRKLMAVSDAPLKRMHPFEVSFVVSSGMRIAEPFDHIANAKTRYNELKLDDVCGLRLSQRTAVGIKEIYSHIGTFRPHIRRTDDTTL